MKRIYLIPLFILFAIHNQAQISAKLMRYVDVSDTQITFVYGGDIWLAPKEGGNAVQLTHSQGEESYPKFSPDGKELAYTANYSGSTDVYVVPTTGGIPTRLTYAAYGDRMLDWHPDGQRTLFASRRETGIPGVNQFFLVDKNGGFAEKLSVPYGELASFSPNGNKLAYITKITENYPFDDGHWFWEGEGVKPDFQVWDDPNILMEGRDPQVEKVVDEVMKSLKQNPPKKHLLQPRRIEQPQA